MTQVSFRSSHGGQPLVPALDVASFRALLPGRVFEPGDGGYDAARAGFSLTDLPAPAFAVMASGAADVRHAVRFAREHALPVGVHGTGHNFGFAREGGVLVNTSRLNGVTVDPERRVARVEAGARWRDVLPKAGAYGLAPLSGSSPDVGVAGYTLFGGVGWLARLHGAAVDSLLAADVVLPDGRSVRADETTHPELFWALRGGGGNFGIVTALELRLYPVDRVYAGALTFPAERADDVLRMYRAWANVMPDALTSSVVLANLPDAPLVPEALRGRRVVTLRACYVGSETNGRRLLAPFRDLGGVLLDTFGMIAYADSGRISNDPVTPSRSWRRSGELVGLPDGFLRVALESFGAGSASTLSVLEIRQLGGALARSSARSAFGRREAPFLMHAIGSLAVPGREAAVKSDMERFMGSVRPFLTGGVIANFLGDGDAGAARSRAAYAADAWLRLEELKASLDDGNLFRHTHGVGMR